MNGVNKKALGNKIRTLRIKNHWTMKDLAGFLGTNTTAISNWENNYSAPTKENIERMAVLFQVSYDELINAGKVNYLSRLKKLREAKEITQSELANELGYKNQQIISFYEMGEREPRIEVLIKLANYFDVSLDYLVGRSDKR